MLAVGDHQCPIITWRWSELSVGLPRLIFISFFLCVCVCVWPGVHRSQCPFLSALQPFSRAVNHTHMGCSQAHVWKSCVWQLLLCRQEFINASWIHGDRKWMWQCYPRKPQSCLLLLHFAHRCLRVHWKSEERIYLPPSIAFKCRS